MHLEPSRTISATEVHDFTTIAIDCFTVALRARKWVILTTTTTMKSSKLPSFKKSSHPEMEKSEVDTPTAQY